jgi:hypothetical protein
MAFKLRILLAFLFVLLTTCVAQASYTDVYFTQAGAGSADGSNCSNALAISFFNNGANWGAGSTQIGPGTTAHLCSGTFSSNIGFQASGTAGNVIKVFFESGAKFSAATWTTDTISANGLTYIEVDGGTNGLIESTNNGSPDHYMFQNLHAGVYLHDGSHTRVHNLTVSNMYIRDDTTDSNSYGEGINLNQCNICQMDHNTVHDAYICYAYGVSANLTSLEINNNTGYNCNWTLAISAAGGAYTVTTALIHDNEFYDWVNWQSFGGDFFHANGLIYFNDGSNDQITDFEVYNNYFHGNPGANPTGAIFLDMVGGLIDTPKIYNNIFDFALHGWSDGDFVSGNPHPLIVNNTFIGNGSDNAIQAGGSTNYTIKNNIFIGVNQSIFFESCCTIAAMDFNDFYTVNYFGPGAMQNSTLAAWRAATGSGCPGTSLDCDSITTNPSLTSYIPSTGSVVYHTGVDLTSLGLTPLDTSKNGIARPNGSPWTMGANDATSSCTPAKLAFTSQPSNTSIGSSLGTVVVQVQDSGSNNCTSDTSTITIANKAATCTGMTLAGTTSTANVFTESNLSENAAGACTLHATDGSLTAGDSNSFTITAPSSGGRGKFAIIH